MKFIRILLKLICWILFVEAVCSILNILLMKYASYFGLIDWNIGYVVGSHIVIVWSAVCFYLWYSVCIRK